MAIEHAAPQDKLVADLYAENERLRELLRQFDIYASTPNDHGYGGSPFEAEVRKAITDHFGASSEGSDSTPQGQ